MIPWLPGQGAEWEATVPKAGGYGGLGLRGGVWVIRSLRNCQ